MSSCRTPCAVNKCSKDASDIKSLGLVGIVVLIGAVVTIVIGILNILSSFVSLGFAIGLWSFDVLLGSFYWIWLLVWGIVAIAIGAMILAGLGFIEMKWSIKDASWILLLVLGIIIAVPTNNWGGIIIVVAAVFKAVNLDVKFK